MITPLEVTHYYLNTYWHVKGKVLDFSKKPELIYRIQGLGKEKAARNGPGGQIRRRSR